MTRERHEPPKEECGEPEPDERDQSEVDRASGTGQGAHVRVTEVGSAIEACGCYGLFAVCSAVNVNVVVVVAPW